MKTRIKYEFLTILALGLAAGALVFLCCVPSTVISADQKAQKAESTGTIKGILIDAETKKAVAGEQVWAFKAEKTEDGRMSYLAAYDSPRATSDDNGRFTISGVAVGTYGLRVRQSFLKVDDDKTTLHVVLDKGGRTIDLGNILVK